LRPFLYLRILTLSQSYLIALWFSLRTHASQIWQNPQQLLHSHESSGGQRLSMYHKLMPASVVTPGLRHKPSFVGSMAPSSLEHQHQQQQHTQPRLDRRPSSIAVGAGAVPSGGAALSFAPPPALLESVGHAVKDTGLAPPQNMTTDDLTRAIAVATVSALRHTERAAPAHRREAALEDGPDAGAHGGHDAPSWSRTTSASVLLGCTALYAIIAELLVDVVDVVLEGSGIEEKFLGITLFALVPNTTEFMNAMSFAVNGNIALRCVFLLRLGYGYS
jgi:Ca2+:H+ antiporter